MNVNYDKLNELLGRRKNYRDDLSRTINEFEEFDLEELQKSFQEGRNEFEIADNRNVFVQCKITKKEMQEGCTKKIKYNRINENGKQESNIIDIKIPSQVQIGQRIIIYGQGNYIKELNTSSDLIVEINFD